MPETIYYTHRLNPNLLQSLVACQFLHKQIPLIQINKKHDPIILQTDEGIINQPNAILIYLCHDNLNGKDKKDEINMYAWFQHFNVELVPLLSELYGQMAGDRSQVMDKFEYSMKQLMHELQLLNTHLKLRTFFIGDSVTSVDISLASQLQTAFKSLIIEQLRKKIPNLVRWFTYMRSTGPFVKIYGELQVCGKEGFSFGVQGGEKVQYEVAISEGVKVYQQHHQQPLQEPNM